MSIIQTSLGYPLTKSDDAWEIDLSGLEIFTGLSVLSKIVGEHIIEQVENNPGDISFLYKINPNINPELIGMNIFYIQAYARAGVLKKILSFKEEFHEQLISVFGTFQRPSWRRIIHPAPENGLDSDLHPSSALVFPFNLVSDNDHVDYQFILERVESQKTCKEFFFRLSIETYQQAILDLKNIPNVIVDDLKTRVYMSGSTKIAESTRDNISNACNSGLKTYIEENRTYSHLFEQLESTRLGRMERICFNWDSDFIEYILTRPPVMSQVLFKKLFLSLEAGSICDILTSSGTIKLKLNGIYFTLYLSQLSRVLNVSINLPRKVFNLNDYLRRMPELTSVARQAGHDMDFENVHIFLIHHITSEILAFIQALNQLKASSLGVLFVKYGGIVPAAYLDALLENTSKSFFTAGLSRKMTEKNKNYYSLTKHFSDISSLSPLQNVLEKSKLNFFEAMKLTAMHVFLKFCKRAEKENKKVLIIEDGGYLGPLLNQFAMEGHSKSDIFKKYHVEHVRGEESFDTFLNRLVIGSIEHTKNGHDRIKQIQDNCSKLFMPAYSIAVSDKKTGEESQEVAHSILSAIESILHENGMVLSRRKGMVLGAEGNIGKCLCKFLTSGRLHDSNRDLLKVDLNCDREAACHYTRVDGAPDDLFCSRDLFIGVVGKSLLKQHHLENLILNGSRERLFFASGSTKTVEFSDLSNWLYTLSSMEVPRVGEIPVHVSYDRITDPQSGIDQGGKVTLRFQKDGEGIKKELYLLSDLSPINFLYYGVPTEMMDTVLSQLLRLSLGMIRQHRAGRLLPPDLYAVDKQIDEWGNLL